jgi:hypothetical protein
MPRSTSSLFGSSSSTTPFCSRSTAVLSTELSATSAASASQIAGSVASTISIRSTSVGTGTDNLDWIATGLPTPTTLLPVNIDSADRKATGPVASHTAVTINDFSAEGFEEFWDVWVGPLISLSYTSNQNYSLGCFSQLRYTSRSIDLD